MINKLWWPIDYYSIFRIFVVCFVHVSWHWWLRVLGLPIKDTSPPDTNKAQPLPTGTTIPRSISHQDNSLFCKHHYHGIKPLIIRTKTFTVGYCPSGVLSSYGSSLRSWSVSHYVLKYTGWPRKTEPSTKYFPQYVDAITGISIWGNFLWEKLMNECHFSWP